MTDTFTREEILAALSIAPCHVTGMHDPSHTTRYICELQLGAGLDNLLRTIGATREDIPHHIPEDCGWCRVPSTQEEYRQRQRELYAWAGVPVPPNIAARGSAS